MMVAGEHKLSRRAVLGGACAVPVFPLCRHPELVSGSGSMGVLPVENWTPDQVRGDEGRWAAAVGRYRRAEARLEAVAHVEDDELFDRALGRHNAALARLLRTAAPDLRAAAAKLDLILAHGVFELTFGPACLAALGRDLRRLAGVTPAS
jgi:hypothetical protein